jgi:UPF0755 protein
VDAGLTALTLLDKLTRGDVLQGEVVLVEGKTFRQFRAVLNEHPDLAHDTQKLSDQEILTRLGAKEAHPEGLFYPDTYVFNKGSSDLDVLRRAYKAMQPGWRQPGNGANHAAPEEPYELLTLASIVEKETGLPRTGPRSPRYSPTGCGAACCCRPIRP